MRKRKTSISTIILGGFTASVIILFQLFCYHSTEFHKKEQKTEQHKKDGDDQKETFVAAPSLSVLSSAHIELTHESFLLFEISFEENIVELPTPKLPFSLGKYFRTLFRIIISPNAP